MVSRVAMKRPLQAAGREAAPKPRRTQAQRTAEMRRRLCDAALEMLCKAGYERLSTAMIAKRARVSRGAQSHHFPAKIDMLVGVFEHLLSQWEESRRAFLANHPQPIPFDVYLRYLWSDVISQPSYVAAVELMLAARSDAALRRRLQKVLDRWAEFRDAIWMEAIDLRGDGAKSRTFLQLNLCVLRGMAIHASFNSDESVNDELLEAWIGLVNKIFHKEAESAPILRLSDARLASEGRGAGSGIERKRGRAR